MFWTSYLVFTLTTLLALTRAYPSASGWQDNNILSNSDSSGWKSGSSGSSGWQDGGSGSIGWQDGASKSTGWQDGGSGSTGWQDSGSKSTGRQDGGSGSTGWQGGASGYGGPSHNFYDSSVSTDYVSRYHGPVALPVVLPDGTIADTPEVAAAKSAHLAALEQAKALWYGPKDDGSYDPHKYEEPDHHERDPSSHTGSSGLHHDHAYSSLHAETHGPANVPYSGPLASTAVLPSGYLADTPAIEAARAAHLTAVYKAEQEAEKWKGQGWKQWK